MGNKIIQKLFMLSIITLGSVSCIYEKMTHLNDDDLRWIECYTEGDTVLFRSNIGNTDTLIVTEVDVWNETNPFYFSEGSDGIYQAGGAYDFVIKQRNDSISGGNIIRKLHESNRLGYFANLKYRFSDDDYQPEGQDVPDSILRLFREVGSEPEDYVKFDDTNSLYTKYWKHIDNKVVCFVISKQHGLEYYKFEDGEEFTRIPD